MKTNLEMAPEISWNGSCPIHKSSFSILGNGSDWGSLFWQSNGMREQLQSCRVSRLSVKATVHSENNGNLIQFCFKEGY